MMNDEYGNSNNNYKELTLLDKLKRAWINEKYAPNLLIYEEDIIRDVMEKIEEKESLCASAISNINLQFTANIYEMEIERLKYIIKCYLVERIKKIDKYYTSILLQIENGDEYDDKLLSEFEINYCQKYKALMDGYFKNTLLNSIPKDFQKMDSNAINKPFLNTFVFCKPREDLGDFLVDDETIDFKKSSIYFLRYLPIKSLVEGGKMDLI
ncbi:hypothetical protein RB653_007307 [Dictyostelium firmibasis]|uniref:DNA replication complex GINS protein SLD5 n=1 Tax=Dictyostelium firmibasis TaxID=79012 RepID=A0AAN7YNW7_9MYCE